MEFTPPSVDTGNDLQTIAPATLLALIITATMLEYSLSMF
ncbi:hypothetical protein C7387_1636 [Yokenella regensburgei]|jgi:hypothetical protein|uniref:Uncharacterized protein n=1 Tax=Yokenella regensburgei TaxID=158877 RepID=A0ABX9S377_9ENTR|nr:hypothetical protein HMPREF0880_03092 [Yokenella regensburgei ATCC 43003]KAF1369425.1 hypothetical protein FHR25_002229 [Yokenella regensburgei]RKR64927.1 hypothetical protein C7387_1636 [Yokenella regensburgei]VFS14462.1 Uncharacterised protein [Yokenella regensburgei]